MLNAAPLPFLSDLNITTLFAYGLTAVIVAVTVIEGVIAIWRSRR